MNFQEKIAFLLIIFTLSPFVNPKLFSQRFEFEKLTSKQGLSHNTVYDITQGEDGKMWFATREGLNSFDSYTIKSYYANKEENNSGLSYNKITALLSSSKGLYVATQYGIDKYDKLKDKFFSVNKGEQLKGAITNLYESSEHKIYITTSQGLYLLNNNDQVKQIIKNENVVDICDYKTKILWVVMGQKIVMTNDIGEIIKEYMLPISSSAPKSCSHYVIYKIFKDYLGDIWVGTSKGLFKFFPEKDTFQHINTGDHLKLEANVIRDIAEDKQRNLWLGTEAGIIIYHPKAKKTQRITQSFDNNINSLSDKAVYSIFMSKENIAWVGTYFGGVNYATLSQSRVKKLMPKKEGDFLRGKAISQIIEDKNKRLWIGTEDGGVTILDKANNSFSYLNNEKDGLSSNNVHTLFEEPDFVWIGTFLGGLNRFDKKSGTIRVYKNQPSNPYSLSNNNVYSILKTSQGKLLVGTEAGLNVYNYDKNNFTPFMPEVFGGKFIYKIFEDSKKNLWICTRFLGIYEIKHNAEELIHYSASGEEVTINSNQIINCNEDSKGNMWFGTLGGGLLKWNGSRFKTYTTENGLPNNNVYGAIEDEQGNIWATSNKGISKIIPGSEKIVNYNISHGLSTNQFNFKSLFKASDGILYFGSINGLNYFSPKDFTQDEKSAAIHFTGLKLFNKDVMIDGEDHLLSKQINYTDSLTFKHAQNVITIEYGAINYKTNGINEYAYFLEGFEEKWNHVGNKTSATYTNLSPGEYTFHVKMLNENGQHTKKSIYLSILPPFWKSNWALLLYGLLLAGTIFAYMRFMKFIHHQRLAVEVEKLEKKKIQEINRHKLNFFTFISHELKTPLTLIIASIEKYFQQKVSPTSEPEVLFSVKKNAQKLTHLIQQLMEFRKIETDHAQLDLQRGDVILFLKDTFTAFEPLFNYKNIAYHFKHNFSEYHCYFDAYKLEMIVTNLISNSIKSIDDEGEVNVEISIANKLDENQYAPLTIKVSDTGRRMSKAQLEKIFNTFYRANSENIEVEGSGLGLALVKSLVDFLHGEINITSEEKIGTTISVCIPLILKHQQEKQAIDIVGNTSVNINPDLFIENITDLQNQPTISEKKNGVLMIVEDNRELMKFLSKYFTEKFKVITAGNGEQAIEKLKKTYPDIIISDVKMQNMGGIELCEKIKSNKDTSYIPFILLSGQTDEMYKMKGLNVGANAYLTKPFSLKELDLIITNILENNKNFKSKFSTISAETGEIPETNQDIEFANTVTSIIEDSYKDPNFSIQELAKKIGISRSLLHLKMKKILKINASDYIRKVRMEKAIQLMKEGMLISEVAYKVGYNDPNYFSRVFKKHFNDSPTDYISKIKNSYNLN